MAAAIGLGSSLNRRQIGVKHGVSSPKLERHGLPVLTYASSALRLPKQNGLSSSTPSSKAALVSRRMQVKVRAEALDGEEDLGKNAVTLRRIGWVSFWAQLALAIVSAIVIFFTLTSHKTGFLPSFPVLFTLGGVIASFISTFFAYGYTRVARRVLIENEKVKVNNVVSTLLVSTRLNIIGLGATLVGLQASVGQLVGKTLASSTSNPYAGAGSGIAQSTPTAIDVFSVQASTNTLMAHFISLFFANWLLRILNKGSQPAQGGPAGLKSGSGPQFQGIS